MSEVDDEGCCVLLGVRGAALRDVAGLLSLLVKGLHLYSLSFLYPPTLLFRSCGATPPAVRSDGAVGRPRLTFLFLFVHFAIT